MIARTRKQLVDLRHGMFARLGFAQEVPIGALDQLVIHSDGPLIGPSLRFGRDDYQAVGISCRVAHPGNMAWGPDPFHLTLVDPPSRLGDARLSVRLSRWSCPKHDTGEQ